MRRDGAACGLSGVGSALVAGLMLLWASAAPGYVMAQDATLQIVIDQPGVGETYYTGPDGPRTLVPIEGHVLGGDFDPTQLAIQLELLQNDKSTGRDTITPDANGRFIFWVSINATGSGELSTPESNCFTCHENATVIVPTGAFTVRITAIDPTGRRAVAERSATLDHARLARLTVQIQVADAADRVVRGMPVEARTLVYNWRGRKFAALTDEHGQASLQVEALTLRPTQYRLSVPPILLDGVLYQTNAPVAFELPAGAGEAGPINLTVTAQLGRLSGALTLPDTASALPDPLTVRAVEMFYGRSFSGMAAGGRFTLTGLPVGQYLVGLDPDQASALGRQARAVPVDFAGQTGAACDLAPAVTTGQTVRGKLVETGGDLLPFGWVTDGKELLAQTGPATGKFALFDVPARQRTLQVSAPGYWSRTIPSTPGGFLPVRLEPQPGTRQVAWGAGKLVLPNATLATVDGDRLSLQRGWLWGHGDRPLTIVTPDAEITIAPGAFAVEYLAGESAWLYLFSGQAEINRGNEPTTQLTGGQMCAFTGKEITRLVPATLDENAIALLGARRALPVTFEAKPGVWSAIQTALAAVGVFDLNPVAAAFVLLAGAALAGALLVLRRHKAWQSGKSHDPVAGQEQ